MNSTGRATIQDAPDGCGYHIHYVDRMGCPTYAACSNYRQAQAFAAAVERDDDDAMNGRISLFLATR